MVLYLNPTFVQMSLLYCLLISNRPCFASPTFSFGLLLFDAEFLFVVLMFNSPLHENAYIAYLKSAFNLFEIMSTLVCCFSNAILFVDVSSQIHNL